MNTNFKNRIEAIDAEIKQLQGECGDLYAVVNLRHNTNMTAAFAPLFSKYEGLTYVDGGFKWGELNVCSLYIREYSYGEQNFYMSLSYYTTSVDVTDGDNKELRRLELLGEIATVLQSKTLAEWHEVYFEGVRGFLQSKDKLQERINDLGKEKSRIESEAARAEESSAWGLANTEEGYRFEKPTALHVNYRCNYWRAVGVRITGTTASGKTVDAAITCQYTRWDGETGDQVTYELVHRDRFRTDALQAAMAGALRDISYEKQREERRKRVMEEA